MLNHFTFNGHSTAEYGLLVTALNPYSAPSRRIEKVEIPYRNGDLVIDSGVYNNIIVSYEVSVINNTKDNFEALRNWLLTSQGYHQLSDTINTDSFRVGCYYQSVDATLTALYKYGKAVISFDCFPQRYLTTNTPITTTATADTTTDTTMSLSTVPTPINISLNGNTTQEGSSGKNLFDSGFFLNAGWTYTNGYYTGTALALKNYSDSVGGVFPNGLNASRITISFDGYKEGTSANTVRVYIGYTDSTNSWVGVTATTSTHFTLTSTSGKTVSNVTFSYGTNATTYIKNFQIELGATETAFEPHISPTNPQPIHNVSGDNVVNVTGKNIFDYEEVTNKGIIDDNGTVQTQNIRLFSGKIAVIPDTTYTFKTSAYSQNNERIYINRLIFYGKDGSFLRRNATYNTLSEATFTIPSDVYFLVIDLRTQAFTTNLSKELLQNNTQLEKGSTATTYEPYTRQSYPLYLPVENLLNQIVNPLEGTYTQNYRDITSSQGNISAYDLEVGVTYTFSVDVECSVLPFRISVGCGTGAYQYDIISQQFTENGRCAITFTPTSTQLANNRTKLAVRIPYFTASTTFTVKVSNMQLEKGSKANHYTPYGTTPIELNKIGTYQDYIYKNGGKWYVHKATGKVDLGTLTWAKSSSGNKYSCTAPQYRYADNMKMFCTAYTFDGAGNSSVGYYGENGTIRYYYSGGTATYELYVHDERGLSASDFKNAVSGVILVYLLRTTTDTEITDTTLINQLNNIEKAYSYNGTTNILQVSNDNGFMLSVLSLHANNVSSTYKGEPIITVNSTGLIYFNGCVIKVNQAPMTINSQTMQAYNGVVNLNNYIEANDFPMIEAGTNVIGSEMPLSIVPNYWKL